MEKWEELFPQNTRKKGRELLENGRIRDLSVNENEYSAAVLGRERYEVKIFMDHGIPVRTECSCAVGRGRGKCAHMAAVLYAAEQEKEEEEKKSRAEQEEERPFPVDGSGWSRWARALKGAEARSPARHPPLGKRRGGGNITFRSVWSFPAMRPCGPNAAVRSVRAAIANIQGTAGANIPQGSLGCWKSI